MQCLPMSISFRRANVAIHLSCFSNNARVMALALACCKTEALASAAGAGITTMEYDLEAEGAAWPFEAGRFSVIVVTNYLHRPLFPQLARSLRPDGILIYETFAQGNQIYGKPSNPDFLLAPGELLGLAQEGMALEVARCGWMTGSWMSLASSPASSSV